MSCVELRKHITVPEDVQYKDIYGNTDKQLKIVKVMKQLLRKRELLVPDKTRTRQEFLSSPVKVMGPTAPVKPGCVATRVSGYQYYDIMIQYYDIVSYFCLRKYIYISQ